MYTLETSGGKMSARPSGEGLINATDAIAHNKPPDVPVVRMKEFELLSSSVKSQALYSVGVAAGNFGKILEKLPDGIKKYTDDIMQGAGIPTSDDPFEGLYPTTPTGFTYKLPFFNDGPVFSKSAGFNETYSGDGMNDLVRGSYEAFKTLSQKSNNVLGTITEPGTFLLKPKFYNPASSSQSVTFSFPLLNTINEKLIERNYNLSWLLLFQNSVRLIDRGVYIPPCIYEITVPGYTYMRYGFVQSIQLEFVGTRRTIEIANIETIIPEAYQITMTLSQLTTDVAEFFDRV